MYCGGLFGSERVSMQLHARSEERGACNYRIFVGRSRPKLDHSHTMLLAPRDARSTEPEISDYHGAARSSTNIISANFGVALYAYS
jgi:hypothetical protein